MYMLQHLLSMAIDMREQLPEWFVFNRPILPRLRCQRRDKGLHSFPEEEQLSAVAASRRHVLLESCRAEAENRRLLL